MGAATQYHYGPSRHQFGDFRPPSDGSSGDESSGPPPLVVNLHGGFWHATYDLTHARPFCAGLRRAGWATLNLEYRRVGNDGGGWPGTFDDVAAGVDLVTSLVADGMVDPDRVALTGHSAGGHLALWAAATTSVDLAGVVAVAAITDLAAAHDAALSDRGTAASDLLGGTPQRWPDRCRDASPITHVPMPIPTVLVHGSDDAQVPLSQSRAFVDADGHAGGSARLRIVAGDDHFAVLDPRSATFAAVTDELATMLAPAARPSR